MTTKKRRNDPSDTALESRADEIFGDAPEGSAALAQANEALRIASERAHVAEAQLAAYQGAIADLIRLVETVKG